MNVWADIFGDHLIGLYIFLNRLTGKVYFNFLENNLFELLGDILYNIDNECGSYIMMPLSISSLMSDAI